MELYGAARSSASFRVRIALAYKGLAHGSGYVSLVKGEHAEAKYRSINTQGLVPALVDDGRLFAQSLAIIEYLEERHPEPPLLPVELPDRAYVRAIAQMVACEMQPLNNLRTLNFLRTGCGLDEVDCPHLVPPLDRRRLCHDRALSDHRASDGPIFPRRHGDRGGLLPGAAGVQRQTLRVRFAAVPDRYGHFRTVHEAARIRALSALRAT